MTALRRATAIVVLVTLIGSSSGAAPTLSPQPSVAESSAYTPDGRLKLPDGYREWVFLSSGLDMSYRPRNGRADHSMFDNVFAEPRAYREFLATGTWPDHTMLVLEEREARQQGSINRSGRFQAGDPMGLEVHVKDTQRFPGGWAFFGFDGREPAQRIPASAECYTCHQQHGAVDTTFVQFYPTLLGIAQEKRTLSIAYQREAPLASH